MARPTKQGLDYFPLDVYVDNKMKFIQMKFGFEGFGIVVALFQHIYSQGFYCKWTTDDAEMFAFENRIDCELLNNIVEISLERGIFCEELFENYSILTSNGIQKRYSEVSKRRKNANVETEFIINEELLQTLCIHNENNMNEECKQDVNICRESKVKESKVNKSKYKEREIAANAAPLSTEKNNDEPDKPEELVKYSEHVEMLPKQYENLVSDLGEERTKEYIERLTDYIGQIGVKTANNKYKSHFHVIKNWYRRDTKEENKTRGKPTSSNRFINFEQREYDFEQIEKKAMKMLLEDTKTEDCREEGG